MDESNKLWMWQKSKEKQAILLTLRDRVVHLQPLIKTKKGTWGDIRRMNTSELQAQCREANENFFMIDEQTACDLLKQYTPKSDLLNKLVPSYIPKHLQYNAYPDPGLITMFDATTFSEEPNEDWLKEHTDAESLWVFIQMQGSGFRRTVLLAKATTGLIVRAFVLDINQNIRPIAFNGKGDLKQLQGWCAANKRTLGCKKLNTAEAYKMALNAYKRTTRGKDLLNYVIKYRGITLDPMYAKEERIEQ